MLGGFDDPPIIIRQSRWKIFLALLIPATVAIGSIASLSDHTALSFMACLLSAVLGALTIFLIGLLLRPGSLTLDGDGVSFFTGLRKFRYSWKDFSRFYVSSPRLFQRQPGFALSNEYQTHHSSAMITGGLGSFGAFWELGAAEIVGVIKEAQNRWGRDQSA